MCEEGWGKVGWVGVSLSTWARPLALIDRPRLTSPLTGRKLFHHLRIARFTSMRSTFLAASRRTGVRAKAMVCLIWLGWIGCVAGGVRWAGMVDGVRGWVLLA